MLETIILILVILWLLGFTTQAVGGLIHILLVVVLVLFIVRLVRGYNI